MYKQPMDVDVPVCALVKETADDNESKSTVSDTSKRNEVIECEMVIDNNNSKTFVCSIHWIVTPGKNVYCDVSKKNIFDLMWCVMVLVMMECQRNTDQEQRNMNQEICNALQEMVMKMRSKVKAKQFSVPIIFVKELQLLCYETFCFDSDYCFKWMKYFLSKSLPIIGSNLEEDLEALFKEVKMEHVARTNILELIHLYDVIIDNEDLLQMMTNWVCVLIKINKFGTELHNFVKHRLEYYVSENTEELEPWKLLQNKLNCWESFQQMRMQ